MANIFTNLLNSTAGDLADTNLKDFAHASRLYVQNFYRLAPKHGFLYFVKFNLNTAVIDSEAWSKSMRDLELGMLVKSVDLPQVTFEGPTLNIYNRKQPVYTKVQYAPVNMALHDDNSGLVRDFWQLYYQYHSADSFYAGVNASPNTIPPKPNNRYSKPTAITPGAKAPAMSPVQNADTGRYGLDTGASQSIIRSIEIYQLSRKVFFMHTLVNPVIRKWDMDTLDQSSNKLMEHRLQIEYEGVYFGKGRISKYNPTGWTDLHYDLNPSPIGGIFGRGSGGLTGPNGLIQDGTNLFADLQGIEDNPNYDSRAALATLLRASRVISNASSLNTEEAKVQIREATARAISFVAMDQMGGSVAGLNMPTSNMATGTTSAQIKTVSPTYTNQNTTNTTSGATPDGSSATQVTK